MKLKLKIVKQGEAKLILIPKSARMNFEYGEEVLVEKLQ